MINIYHMGFLPKNLPSNTKLYRPPFVYLHGKAEAPSYRVDAPDICMSDVPLEDIEDTGKLGLDCLVHMGEEAKEGCMIIWTTGKIEYAEGQYKVVNPKRQGLIVLWEDDQGMTEAENAYPY